MVTIYQVFIAMILDLNVNFEHYITQSSFIITWTCRTVLVQLIAHISDMVIADVR